MQSIQGKYEALTKFMYQHDVNFSNSEEDMCSDGEDINLIDFNDDNTFNKNNKRLRDSMSSNRIDAKRA